MYVAILLQSKRTSIHAGTFNYTLSISLFDGISKQIKMKDIFESSTEVYIVLELAIGGELFDRIVKKGHYSEKEAAKVCYQVLSALEVVKKHRHMSYI